MAQKTTLTLTGIYGPPLIFVAKEAAPAFTPPAGPFFSGGVLPLEYQKPTWEVWLQRYDGTQLVPLTDIAIRGHLVIALNSLWSFSLVLPLDKLTRSPEQGGKGYKDIPLDSMLEFTRTHGQSKSFSFYKRATRPRTHDTLTIAGFGLNHLVRRRWIAYYAGSSYASKTAPLDDLAKAIVRENCTSAAVLFDDTGTPDTDRDYAQMGLDFTVQVDGSSAPSDTVGFAWQNVWDTLLDLAANSAEQGTRLFFQVERLGATRFQFQTYTDHYGVDRRGGQAFGSKFGNLSETQFTLDHSEEVTVLYVAGRGDQDKRKVVKVENLTRRNASAINRIERVYNATTTDDSKLAGVGNQVLDTYKPLRLLNGKLMSRPGSYYGIDWDLGDLIDLEDGGEEFSALVTAVEFDFGAGGETSAQGRFALINE